MLDLTPGPLHNMSLEYLNCFRFYPFKLLLLEIHPGDLICVMFDDDEKQCGEVCLICFDYVMKGTMVEPLQTRYSACLRIYAKLWTKRTFLRRYYYSSPASQVESPNRCLCDFHRIINWEFKIPQTRKKIPSCPPITSHRNSRELRDRVVPRRESSRVRNPACPHVANSFLLGIRMITAQVYP
ncbi:hypothetical protein BD410DRAFT_429755 [Rickenella mellea]|uniref:Uncharacterized protein n=1 Tax=Rickenella mellea TaxID=50990 RepID=A0A4Y7QKL1_9AGAM|nr:hypothetical protein BD410DRAFT_429755 [Rickenella mellea]